MTIFNNFCVVQVDEIRFRSNCSAKIDVTMSIEEKPFKQKSNSRNSKFMAAEYKIAARVVDIVV